jgi:calcineurin-like phosphoesterase family protein
VDFFTAGWNLNHFGIIKYTGRPFESVDEMNACLVNNCNRTVGPEDRLFFVGDFVFGPLDDEKFLKTVRYFRKKILCNNIFLIYGNHDRRARKNAAFRQHFVNCCDYLEIKSEEDQSVILSHYPIVDGCWNRYSDGAWHFHGPTNKAIGGEAANCRVIVGVDNCGEIFVKKSVDFFRPFSYNDIKNWISLRPKSVGNA